MCGICGAVGTADVVKTLVDGIRALDYRGYDSAGIAVLDPRGGRLALRKNVGSVEEVEKRERFAAMRGRIGIAHTRWATHGGVTRHNTHPHTCCAGRIAVVHNGIISNYVQLREKLAALGHKFVSETDTEVVPHLIEEYKKSEKSAEAAFRKAVRELGGSFAVAAIDESEPGKIFIAKHESPLLIGLGRSTNYVGSDFNAFLRHTKESIVLEDGEYGIVQQDGYVIKETATGRPVEKQVYHIEQDSRMADKGGYPHYMLKEIHEQPNTIARALEVEKQAVESAAKIAASADRLYLTGVGTTYYVALTGEYWFSRHAGVFAPAISADEFEYLAELGPKSAVIALSQSGETYDTLSALRYVKKRKAKSVAVVNVEGSTMARLVDRPILQGSGPEISVISTKAAVTQMTILIRLALETALIKKRITAREKKSLEAKVANLPRVIQEVLNEQSGYIRQLAVKFHQNKNWLYLGRGIYYPIALEAALKMKEVAYIHAEGMPAGFLKHGTIALIDDDMKTVMFMPGEKEEMLFKQSMSAAEEVKARGGEILAFHSSQKLRKDKFFKNEVVLPEIDPLVMPILELIVGQLFSYFTAVQLKRNVDRPRSLAKSVTVA